MSAPKRSIYLDWNATTPPLESVLEQMREVAASDWGNPASVHGVGRRARKRVEEARERLAALTDLHPRDVVFTSGGTEANNLALAGLDALVTSRIEHPSVTRVAEALEAQGGQVEWLPVAQDGRVSAADVRAALGRVSAPSERTAVAVMAVNHETGVIQELEAIFEVTTGRGVRLHVDAVQALGKVDPALFAHADSLSFAAHKIRGPKGIGALGWRGAFAPRPVLVGGAQERGFRPGTVDPVLASGFAAALEHAQAGPSRYAVLGSLRDQIETRLSRYVQVNGASARRAPHVSNLSVSGWEGDELVAALDVEGICISSGSACSAGTTEPSTVIDAMLGSERAKSAVRISLGEATTPAHVDSALGVMLRILDR